MYSASDGKKLCELPDLDIPPHRDPQKKRQHDGASSSKINANPNNSDLTAIPRKTDIITTSGSRRKGEKGKKQRIELLSDTQKRANHIASEQKRRANIRIGYNQLTDIVPTLSHCYKSESLILKKSYDYIQELLENKAILKDRIRELQITLGDTPDEDSSEDDNEYFM